MVKNVKSVTMAPHKSKLSRMDEATQASNSFGNIPLDNRFPPQQAHVRVVDVERHNIKHANDMQKEKAVDEDKVLDRLRKRQLRAPKLAIIRIFPT